MISPTPMLGADCRAACGGRDGTDLEEAIRQGAILRLRPIMMTALVAAFGLLPVALATGVGTDSQRPFALVFLMPVLYALVARPGDRLEV